MSSYNRKSVNLIEESRRFGKKDRKVFGKCILETKEKKGKILIRCENLKEEFMYETYLIFLENGQYVAVHIDKLISENNIHQLKKISNKNTLEGKFKVEEALAVLVLVKNGRDIVPVLVGFFKNEIRYKNNFYIYKNSQDEQEKKELEHNKSKLKEKKELEHNKSKLKEEKELEHNKSKIKEEKELEEKEYYENLIRKNNNTESLDVHKEENEEEYIEEIIDETDDTYKRLENTEQLGIDTAREMFLNELFRNKDKKENLFETLALKLKTEYEEIIELQQSALEDTNGSLQIDSNDPKGNVNYLFKNFDELNPFSREKFEVKWVSIGIEDISSVFDNCWEIKKNEVLMNGYKKYNHLILGTYRENEKEKYILGIPSEYEEEDIDMVKPIGEVEYKEVDKERYEKVCPGYWLVLL